MSDLLWEHYNARGLTPEMVARSFVAPKQFEEVARARNSVLLGPRGSGKTTLLRMLDPRALGTWEEPNGRSIKTAIDYVGVFVPVDAAWISSLDKALSPLGDDVRRNAHLSVYSLAVARALVEAMVWRLGESCRRNEERFYVQFDRNQQLTLIRHLSHLWLGDREALSLLELRLMLTRELAMLPTRLVQADDRERMSLLATTESPTKLAATACEGFNLIANEERKWALLCDELEIAPATVQTHLFATLRASPQPLLLKLALTPALKLPQVPGAEHPVPANDYDSISLSYATREEGVGERSREEFCRGIWRGLVSSTNTDATDTLLNAESAFESPTHTGHHGKEGDFEKFSADRRFGQKFRALAAMDSSFAEYLQRKGVDVQDLDANPHLLDSVVRKVRPLVEIRSFYLKQHSVRGVGRASRKAPIPYCGARNIFAVSESHPRWLKSTLSGMLESARGRAPHISIVAQSREIKFSVDRVVARLKSFPMVGELSTYSFITRVGEFFQQQVIGPRFISDPYFSFEVDDAVDDDDVHQCLKDALYIGALVPLDLNSHNYIVSGLTGGRFRLSNWLAPHFKLPLVAGKSIKLSALLDRNRYQAEVIAASQLSLGLEDESES